MKQKIVLSIPTAKTLDDQNVRMKSTVLDGAHRLAANIASSKKLLYPLF